MSDEQRMERRRTPRVTLGRDVRLGLERRTRVRIVDLSVSGALIAPEEPLPVGTVGRLRFTLGVQPVETHLDVLRTHLGSEVGRVPWVGGSIRPTETRHRVVLEQFLGRAEES